MLKPLSAALCFIAGTVLAQTQPDQATPTVPPSPTPSTVPPSTTPPFGGPPPGLGTTTVGGLSRCENMIGAERDRCLQTDSAAAGGSNQPPATAWPQDNPPTGTVVR